MLYNLLKLTKTTASGYQSSFPCSALSTIIILGGTFVNSLILANVLIAQLSESYAVSKSNAALHYDIAKLTFVTRMENSRFHFMVLHFRSDI